MSTRSKISISFNSSNYFGEGNPNNNKLTTHHLYHHYDGYIEGVGLELQKWLTQIVESTNRSRSTLKGITEIDEKYLNELPRRYIDFTPEQFDKYETDYIYQIIGTPYEISLTYLEYNFNRRKYEKKGTILKIKLDNDHYNIVERLDILDLKKI